MLIAHELTESNRELLMEGMMDAVLDQNPHIEALRAVELLMREHQRMPESALTLETPVSIFLRENLPVRE